MHLGLIGFGNIATTLLAFMAERGMGPKRLTVLAPAAKAEATAKRLAEAFGPEAGVVGDAAALLARAPDLVVECAGHAAVAAHVPMLLRAGVDVIVVSVGALCDGALEATLRRAAQEGGARIVLPAGAVGGIDLLGALSAAGPIEVRYSGTKPPMAWAGTPAESLIDLASLSEAAVFFRGTAREAASTFPKNANVAATLALAGAGLDATRVELVADPAAAGNIHAYEVRSPVANYRMEIENLPSAGNVKTSVSTIYSVLREIRNRTATVAI